MPITYKEEETTEGNDFHARNVIMQKLETTTLEGDGKHKETVRTCGRGIPDPRKINWRSSRVSRE